MDDEKRITSTGQGEISKPSAFNRFASRFIKEDASVIKDRIVDDAIIPSIKRIISDIVDMVLYGEKRSTTSYSSFSSGRLGQMISYGSMFDKKQKPAEVEQRPVDIGQVTVPTREAAERCIEQMMEIESRYGHVRVSDLYDYFGEACSRTLNSYGWRNFASAKVKPLVDGRYLIVPPMMELLQTN